MKNILLILALAVLPSTCTQAQGFHFSGGNGTQLTISLSSDLQFTATAACINNGGAIIFYDDTAFYTSQAFQQANSTVLSGLVLTDSRTGIIPQLGWDCCSSYAYQFFYGYFTTSNTSDIQVGDILTLSAGSAITTGVFNAPTPIPSDSFSVKNNYGGLIGTGTISPVPEPSTLALAGLGGLGMLWQLRRR